MNNVLKQINRNLAVLSALFITVVTSKIRFHQNCGPEELIQCATPLNVLTDSGLTFAATKPDLDKMCPDLKEAVKCIHGYARHCMDRKRQQHFKELFQGTVHMVSDLCRNETYQEEYLKYAPCMQRVEFENEVCLKRYTKAILKLEAQTTTEAALLEPDLVTYQKRKRAAADESIKSVCCSFRQYLECSTHTMRRACGEDAAQFSREFLDKISSTLIKRHCREYGLRECGLMSSADPAKISTVLVTLLSILVYYLR